MTHEVVLQGYNVKPGSLQLGTFDSYGIEKIHVTADDSWDGLDILAVFHAPDGTATKVVVGANGMLAVPPEATAKQAGGGRIVFAGLAENVQRITVDMRYSTKPHSDIEGDNPGTPTPDVVQQILTEAQNANVNSAKAKKLATDAKDIAQSVRDDADNGKFNGKDGAKGDKGDVGTTPQLKIGEDNLWNVSYDNGATWVSLGVKATGAAGKDGTNGLTPHIGENGNWWVGNTDTGVSAKGPAGERGPAGQPGPENLVIITATASTTVQGEYNPDTTYTKALADIQANKAVMIKLENVPGRYYIPYSSSNAEILASAGTVSNSKQSIELYTLKWAAQTNIITLTGTREGCIADGGTAGQVLVKKSDDNFDTEWINNFTFIKISQTTQADLIEKYKKGPVFIYSNYTNKCYYVCGYINNNLYAMSFTDAYLGILYVNRLSILPDNSYIETQFTVSTVPDGGLTGQILAKKSNTNGDTEWIDPPSVEIPEDYPQIREDVSQLKEDIVDYLHIDSDNIFDPSKVTKNKYVNSKGEELDTSSYELSEYIPVPFVGDNYLYFNKDAVSSEYSDYKGVHQIILYDSNKIFIKRVACIGALYLAFNQANAKYMRLMIGSNTKDLMVVVSNKYDATFSPTYIPYGGVYSKNFKNEVNDIIDKRQENDTERPLEHIIRDGGLTRIFRTAGVVGDSLSSGCMEYKGSSGNALGYDRYEFSWIQQMRGICGFDKAENFSVGGLTSKTFWTTQSQKVKNLREDGENHKCQLYFIALGVNDIADTTMEVGTPDDITNESSTTFYGYYSRIKKLIQRQQPKARINLVGLPNHNKMTIWGKRFTDFKNAIADMPNHFNFVYYLNLYEYEKPYDSEFQKIYFNGFHENALGYARTAWVISSYVDWYIRHNYEEFREVGFIGTDYHYYD